MMPVCIPGGDLGLHSDIHSVHTLVDGWMDGSIGLVMLILSASVVSPLFPPRRTDVNPRPALRLS